MDRESALEDMTSASTEDRLAAIRFLVKAARDEDLPVLVDALKKETVPWIKHALSKAITRLSGSTDGAINSVTANSQDTEYELIDEVRDHALETTTRTLTHEIEPVLGVVRYYAEKEIPEYKESQTKKHLDRIKRLLDGIKTLGKVAGAPHLEQFDLKNTVEESVASESTHVKLEVQIARDEPLPVVADRSYIELALINGLRNAIESSESMAPENKDAITINFGKTATDYWITVLDRGIGLKVSGPGIFELGNSGKEGHEGMGLALSQRAMKSLKGSVKVVPREGGGVRYEIRWPLSIGVSDETASR
jgi:signal transduction histidine kinase